LSLGKSGRAKPGHGFVGPAHGSTQSTSFPASAATDGNLGTR
jgi:hypothetical protein